MADPGESSRLRRLVTACLAVILIVAEATTGTAAELWSLQPFRAGSPTASWP